MDFYHYYDRSTGPFRSLTALSDEEACSVLETVKSQHPHSMCALRDEQYIQKRRRCESLIRREFAAKGGITETDTPFYMTLEHTPWMETWYEICGFIKIPAEEFDLRTVSFTYGDSMPTFSPLVNDGKEYRKKVYTYEEIFEIIKKYGLPQDWNPDGKYGPERYIEVHIWSDKVIKRYYDYTYAVKMVYDRKEVPVSSIQCVPFRKELSDEYKRIYNECFYNMRKTLDIEPYNWYKSSDDLSDKADNTYLLMDKDGIVGSVSCTDNEIDDLFVRRGEQGKGYGRQLLYWAMRKIREKNDLPVTLRAAEWNTNAVRLYEQTGFVTVERTLIKTTTGHEGDDKGI